MACETLCIYGESGTGKSTSLRNMNPETTFIISTTGE
jgi:ABC-type dipeptide/oligopeptide/nickel transport system ATPase subunit